MNKYFGTDGVRGVANQELTPELVYKLGRAAAYILTKHQKRAAKIIVGMDTRISSNMLEAALVAGICSVGVDVCCLGVVPTSAVAYLVKKYNAIAGVMISASHNKVEDNGIKFFDHNGFKLNDELERQIEILIDENFEQIPRPTGAFVGKKEVKQNYLSDYEAFIINTTDVDFKDMNVCIDCANGSLSKTAPKVLNSLCANVLTINNDPDGVNINLNCGSTHMNQLVSFVKKQQNCVGFAFDGDGDRCLAVDENGEIVDGDQIDYLKMIC